LPVPLLLPPFFKGRAGVGKKAKTNKQNIEKLEIPENP
jgi:hypothetical protein